MADFAIHRGTLPFIPDDLTIPQFMLDATHPSRPVNTNPTWMIDDETGKKVGFEELRTRTFGLANELHSRYQIGENDVVCLFSPNHIDWPVALWAVHRLGGMVTTGNPAYTADELLHQLTLTKTSLIIACSESIETALTAGKAAGIAPDRIILIDSRPASVSAACSTLDELIHRGLSKLPTFIERRLSPGEAKTKIALFCFSSGTTGKPKAVAISHYALMANILQIRTAMAFETPDRFTPGDTTLAVLPFFHVFGVVINLHYHLWLGVTVVAVKRFVFENFLNSIQKYRIRHIYTVPPVCVLLCKSPLAKKYDLSSLKWLMSSAAPLSAELTHQLNEAFPDCYVGQGYGMTETFTAVTMTSAGQQIPTPGSAGQLLPGVHARVLKADGSPAKVGETGELLISSPSLALGYWKDDKATKETFIDGYVRTGDEVMFNEKHELFIVDRIKELIKVKGFQVAPAELEGHLLSHSDVADVCVVGIPDEMRGELPLAFVVPSGSAQARIAKNPSEAEKVKQELIKYVADHKIGYKRLTGGVEFIEAIPKNPSGKLLRRVLRDMVRARNANETKLSKAKL